MPTRVLFHLDWENEDALIMTLNNIENLFKEVSADNAAVSVVANGSAVRLFLKERAGEYAARIKNLSGVNVHFLVCKNSLTNMGIESTALLDPCRVIPAGIVEIIRLQGEGFAYVKP